MTARITVSFQANAIGKAICNAIGEGTDGPSDTHYALRWAADLPVNVRHLPRLQVAGEIVAPTQFGMTANGLDAFEPTMHGWPSSPSKRDPPPIQDAPPMQKRIQGGAMQRFDEPAPPMQQRIQGGAMQRVDEPRYKLESNHPPRGPLKLITEKVKVKPQPRFWRPQVKKHCCQQRTKASQDSNAHFRSPTYTLCRNSKVSVIDQMKIFTEDMFNCGEPQYDDTRRVDVREEYADDEVGQCTLLDPSFLASLFGEHNIGRLTSGGHT
eukprot:4876992-Amphidinium_carterae.1